MNPSPVESICRLCGKSAPLQNSHIVPEFLYEHCYDKKGRTMILPVRKDKVKIAQKGMRMKLLCTACEQFLNDQYEKPFHLFWSQCVQIQNPILENILILSGFDYRVFKLFHLSVIWRFMVSGAGVTADPGWADRISRSAEILRQLLLQGDPGESRSYSVMGACIVNPGTRLCMRGVIVPPTIGGSAEFLMSTMTYDGFEWMIYHAPNSFPGMDKFTLKSHGEIHCPVVEFPRHRPLLELLKKFSPELIQNANRYAGRTN